MTKYFTGEKEFCFSTFGHSKVKKHFYFHEIFPWSILRIAALLVYSVTLQQQTPEKYILWRSQNLNSFKPTLRNFCTYHCFEQKFREINVFTKYHYWKLISQYSFLMINKMIHFSTLCVVPIKKYFHKIFPYQHFVKKSI